MIGPHEDRELELMLANTKPASLITPPRNIKGFEPYINVGKFLCEQISNTTTVYKSWVIVQASERYRIAAISAIYSEVRTKGYMADEDHIALGKLLGYSDEDIADFVNQRN